MDNISPDIFTAISCYILCLQPILLSVLVFVGLQRYSRRRPKLIISRLLAKRGERRTVITLTSLDRALDNQEQE